ncbi:asparaginase [Paenalcaligenes hominis]|uniref:asparaginase n=1 Tax=Paenalcaligenes hominis TaxID=643674 RepID=UPI0035262ED9
MTLGKERVAVIGTGGTFAMYGRHEFDWVEYSESGIVRPIEELIAMLGELTTAVEIVPISFRLLGSTGIVPQDWLELAQLIIHTAKNDPTLTRFVITHGTATLEETAWFLSLVLPKELNVVVTGAQRPENTAGSDVKANLRAALAVVSCTKSQHFGVTVVMDNTIFSARDVVKASSFELAAFEAPMYGPLGVVDAEARVHWRRYVPSNAQARIDFNKLSRSELPRVDIVPSYAGADEVMINACVAAGAQGLISSGLVPGRPANGETSALRSAVAEGIVVVQSSRGPRGHVPVQDFLLRDGILAGGDLAPNKLRILLMLALAVGVKRDELQDFILDF